MSECCENSVYLRTLPTELLLFIFRCLPAKDLIKNRRVCKRWNEIIGTAYADDKLWMRFCATDYKSLYIDAKRKSFANKLWFDIYKSLTLWSRLSAATESIDEFCHSSAVADEIRSLHFLENGVMMAHKKSYVAFYDINTLKMTDRHCITGDFTRFRDCGDFVVAISCQLQLYVLPNPYQFPMIHQYIPAFNQIKFFIVVKRELYLLSFNDTIMHYLVDDATYTQDLHRRSTRSIMTLSYCNGCLHYITTDCLIYAYRNNKFVKLFSIKTQPNPFDCIWRYKFYKSVDWDLFYSWALQMKFDIPNGPLRHISTMKHYGDTFFIGSNIGLCLIYYKPYTNGLLDLINHQPVKQYNFSDRIGITVNLKPILNFDVVEIKDGHKVLVAMARKIIVITFQHDLNEKCKTVSTYIPAGSNLQPWKASKHK